MMGKPKLIAPKPKPPSLSTLAASMGISPDVPTEDLISPSGYTGTSGATRLVKELDALKGDQRTGRIRVRRSCFLTRAGRTDWFGVQEILEKFCGSEGKVPGWQKGRGI